MSAPNSSPERGRTQRHRHFVFALAATLTARALAQGSSVLPNGAALVNDGKIFTPFWTDPIAMKPGTMGGANWPPSSYDPETHLLYVCASDRINSLSVQNELPQPSANQVYMGGRFTTGIQ